MFIFLDILILMIQSWVGKLPNYPHPVASQISSRMMVELGVATIMIAAAAFLIGGFLASAVFSFTGFVFFTVVNVVWPIIRPFLKLSLGLIFGICERVWDNVGDFFEYGGGFSKLQEVFIYCGISDSLELIVPISTIVLIMVLLLRFTLSRRPKNFRKWVCPFLFIFPPVLLLSVHLHLFQVLEVKIILTSFLLLCHRVQRSMTKKEFLILMESV